MMDERAGMTDEEIWELEKSVKPVCIVLVVMISFHFFSLLTYVFFCGHLLLL